MSWFIKVEGRKASAIKKALGALDAEFTRKCETRQQDLGQILDSMLQMARRISADTSTLQAMQDSIQGRLDNYMIEQQVLYAERKDFLVGSFFDGKDVSFEVARDAGFHLEYAEGDKFAVIQIGSHDPMSPDELQ